MSKKLMKYFNKQPRLGCMSTSGKDGKVNVACFGSPHMEQSSWELVRTELFKIFRIIPMRFL